MSHSALHLTRSMRARLLPLVFLLVAVVSLSAPAASLLLGLREQRSRAAATSLQISRFLRREVRQRPVLWRYNMLSLKRHLEVYTQQSNVLAVEVTDHHGNPVGLARAARLEGQGPLDSIWGSAPMAIINRSGARVWVAVSTRGVYVNALVMLAAFFAMGLALAGLLYLIPMGALRRAERRMGDLLEELRQSHAEVSSLNQSLEGKVERRSAQLRGAFSQLQSKERRLREVSARAVTMQEGERRAIARDLHDSAGQSLTAIRLKMQLLKMTAQREEDQQLVDELMSLTDETVEDIRRAVMSLGPAIVDEIGLGRALERYADNFAERTGVEVEGNVGDPGDDLRRGLESACYRLAQEALNNVAKHASAQTVSLRLERVGDLLVLEVADDGRGFEPETLETSGHGLAGMRERAELLGGTLDLDSSTGQGTRLVFSLPVDPGSEPSLASGAQTRQDEEREEEE